MKILRKNFDILFEKTPRTESGLTASHEIAQIIAKTESVQTVAENVLKPSFEILIKAMLQQDLVSVLKALPLSNDSIRIRIDEMTSDVESQLKTGKFSIQLDQSLVSNNKAILMAYVRFIDDS